MQAIIFGIGLFQLANRVDRPWIFTGGAAGVLLLIGLIVAGLLVAMTVLTEVAAGLRRHRIAVAMPRPGAGPRPSPTT